MEGDPKAPEDIERVKRVLYLLYNSGYSLNFFERTYQKDLELLELKLELIKSEKPLIVFEKPQRAKGVTYVSLELQVRHSPRHLNTVSKAKITNEGAAEFEAEIQKQGYLIETNNEHFRTYKLLK
jgi:hypothetical protein